MARGSIEGGQSSQSRANIDHPVDHRGRRITINAAIHKLGDPAILAGCRVKGIHAAFACTTNCGADVDYAVRHGWRGTSAPKGVGGPEGMTCSRVKSTDPAIFRANIDNTVDHRGRGTDRASCNGSGPAHA